MRDARKRTATRAISSTPTDPALTYPGVPPEFFMALAFDEPAGGQVSYHAAFYVSANSAPS